MSQLEAENRYMVRDILSLDDSVARIEMAFPDAVTKDELEDIKAWFALRVRCWERRLMVSAQKDET